MSEDRKIEVPESELVTLRAKAEHDDKVRAMEREVASKRIDYEVAKNRSLVAKKSFDSAVDELQELIAEAPDSQLKLFPVVGEQEGETNSGPTADWKDQPVSVLGLSPKSTEKLIEIGVHNVGQAVTLKAGRAPGFPNGAADIPRWGAKKVVEFEDALAKVSPVDAADLMGEDDPDDDDYVEAAVAPAADGANDEPAEPAAPDGRNARNNRQTMQADEPPPVDLNAGALAEPADDDPGGEPEPGPNDGQEMRVRIVADVEGMEEVGLVQGKEFDAVIEMGMVVIEGTDGGRYSLEASEYEVIDDAVPAGN